MERSQRLFVLRAVKEERSWNFGGCEISEVEEYKYLGVTVKAGLNGGFKSMGDRMVDANGVLFLEEDLLISTNNIYRIVEKKGIRNTVRTIMRKERETNPRKP